MTQISMKLNIVAVCLALLFTGCSDSAWTRKPPKADRLRDFDWNVIERMIASGVSSNDRYTVEEVALRHVPMPSAKVFVVVDKQFEALLGPKQALLTYYPGSKVLVHDHDHLKRILESRQYKADSPDALLALASEVVPLLYGSRPTQHEVVTESDLIGSGRLPITKDTIQLQGPLAGMFVNYYAKLGPWGDIVNITAVLHGQRLQVSIHPIYLVPRVYE